LTAPKKKPAFSFGENAGFLLSKTVSVLGGISRHYVIGGPT